MREERRHSTALLFGLATHALADRSLMRNSLAATNLRNFPEAQHRNFRVSLYPLASLIPLGDGDYIMSPRISGLVSSRDRSLGYLLIACSLVVAIILILISINASASTVWADVAASKQTINLARKGDRLPLVLASDPNPPDWSMEVNGPQRSVYHSLPDGCEALASSLTRSAVAHIAGSCLS